MKKLFKYLAVLFGFSFVLLFSDCSFAFADFAFPSEPYSSNMPGSFSFQDSLVALRSNASLNNANLDFNSCRVFFKFNPNSQMVDVFVVPNSAIVDCTVKTFFYYERTYSAIKFMNGYKTYCTLGALSSTTFVPFTQVDNTIFGSTDTWGCVNITDGFNSNPYIVVPLFVDNERGGAYNSGELNANLGTSFGQFFVPFNPSYELNGVVVGFDFSTEAFVQWLIDTDKYLDLPSYIGLSKLTSFVDFYRQWGSSNDTFISKIIDWYSHFNIVSQSLENRRILKNTIDRLYQEYCNQAFVTIQHDSSRLPHHRRNIETVTSDDYLTLVTDDSNDDIYTSLLRDILRGVISIPGQIYNCTEMIISKLDYLNWNVSISNDGGSSGTDLSPVLSKMDDIIDALGSDTVSVEIDQTTKDNTDDFFDDWNLQFSTALNNKFPVASQLRTFFTGFFERCGIDADSDGEVYQYYNPGVLTSSSVSRSAGTASEDDIVTEFLGKFDNSDPSFLDDASFHGVPDLSVSVGGHSVSIIDFRVYAKYRDKIHFIISFVIWTLYLLHLYKALPQIIGQVADVAVKTSDL